MTLGPYPPLFLKRKLQLHCQNQIRISRNATMTYGRPICGISRKRDGENKYKDTRRTIKEKQTGEFLIVWVSVV